MIINSPFNRLNRNTPKSIALVVLTTNKLVHLTAPASQFATLTPQRIAGVGITVPGGIYLPASIGKTSITSQNPKKAANVVISATVLPAPKTPSTSPMNVSVAVGLFSLTVTKLYDWRNR